MALTRITSGGIAEGVVIKFDSNNTPTSPAVSFEGSPQTGIYSPDTNELAISTNGEERLRFKSDGRIVTGNGTYLGGTNPDFANAKNVVMYVNQSDINATDSPINDGGNINAPFKTIERALLEASKKSLKPSADDRFEAYTIMVLPGEYVIDNRPGVDVVTNPLNTSLKENPGDTINSTGDLENGSAWRFNPRNGGVIVPRGTSIVGYDLRKTVIRPKYVPQPRLANDLYEEGSITADGYVLSNLLYDASNMITKARGWIQEQTIMFLNAEYSTVYQNLSAYEQGLCKRDIGYFLDALIEDLKEGGNQNSFVLGEFYVNGGGSSVYNFLGSTEVTPTREAFRFAAELAIKVINDFSGTAPASWFKWTNDVTSSNQSVTSSTFDTDTGNSYSYAGFTGGVTSTTNRGIGTSGSLTSTITIPLFTANEDYASNRTANACSTVDTTIINLFSVVDTILANPDDYADAVNKVPGVDHQTAIFKVTGGCYFWQMTFKDAFVDNPLNPGSATPNTIPSVSYVGGVPTFESLVVPNYSHHRVVAFTYADQRTADGELDRYYRRIDDWDTTDGGVAREARVEEYQIVGDSSDKKKIDTVNSCSPYIFNCSLRSVFGLCGMHTDGSKVKDNSFKSMVVAQFTGISLQKDEDAYWQPKNKTGKVYKTTGESLATGDTVRNVTATDPIFADPDAEYKHNWRHFHIKASNGAFIQVVSVFAVGYADQFLAVNGGDMSITNSNSNFGQISLRSAGSKFKADPPSSYGRITALIPPAGITTSSTYTELYPISSDSTLQELVASKAKSDWESQLDKYTTVGNFFKLYLDIPGVEDENDIPELVVESKDLKDGSTKVKRFLTYGATNNYNLFREYYNESGVLNPNDCIITNVVESTTGESTFTAVVNTTQNLNSTGKNKERVGYYWDATQQKVYLLLDPSSSVTRSYISDFIFKSEIQTEFVTEIKTINGADVVVSSTQNVEVLSYWEGFPGSVSIAKFVDSRGSNPDDLLWRVKYVIPKNYQRDIVNGPIADSFTPKPPEKRFIIRGTNPKNDPNGIPYTNYSFTIWDVKEIQTWERGVRDGEYYLTILRSDIDEFMDGEDGSGFENDTYQLTRNDGYNKIVADRLSKLAFDDKNYRVTSNVNYLYPSTNEEGNVTNPRVIWNPPQMDSRVVVEQVGGGARAKDTSVPNKKYYNDDQNTTTPFYDVPALASLTAEAVHRLVSALDLVYLTGSGLSTTSVKIAPVVNWDSRSGQSTYTDISTSFNVYGTTGNGFRYGSGTTTVTETVLQSTNNINAYGISNTEELRKIPVAVRGTSESFSVTTSSEDTLVYDVAPIVPLLRPSILRASSHTWEYIGIGPGNYSTGFPNLQTRVLKAYEQFIAQGYENSGGFVASSGTNSQGDFYIGNQVIQAGGQSTTTLNVPKVRKSSESNVVDFSDIENRVSNSVVNVIPSANKSSAQQNLLKGLSNFFTTARLSVTDTATVQTLSILDRLYIANSSILNAEKFPEGGPEGYGFVKGARPEKTGFISTDTNDRLYVSPKFLDAWRIKKKILSASNINLDNNRIYIEPLSRTFTNNLPTSSTVALGSPVTFTGNITSGGVISSITFTGLSSGTIDTNIYVGMKVAQLAANADKIVGEAIVTDINSTTITLSGATFTVGTSIQFVGVDRLSLLDTSGIPPFGRIDLEMTLDNVSENDYFVDNNVKYYLNPNINISLQYDDVDYTNNTVSILSTQNLSAYKTYVDSILPTQTNKFLHTIIKNYPSVSSVITNDDELSSGRYLEGAITANVASNIVGEVSNNTLGTDISVSSDFYAAIPNRGSVTLRFSSSGLIIYSTYVYYKSASANKLSLLRKVENQSKNDKDYTYITSTAKIYFSGCKTFASYADKWTVESAFIPDVEEISEDVDIESATLYTLPQKPVPWTDYISEKYTDTIVPNPVTSKALGANLQTKRTVKSFQPFENLKQIADFAKSQGFTANDFVEVLMKPGYYRLNALDQSESQLKDAGYDLDAYGRNIEFPCKVRINGSGSQKTSEQYSKELANAPAGRIGGYSLDTVKSGDSVIFYRSPAIRNNWDGRTDLLYVDNIGDAIYSTGGIEINNVHFLGINDAITRNEILDNAYSTDSFTISARRKVRKSWYVKKSKGFPVSERGVDGGLSFQVKYEGNSADANFTYHVKSDELTTSSFVVNTTTVSTETEDYGKSKDARYLRIRFTKSTNEERFNWVSEYVIPGTTLYYFPNQSTQNVVASTKKTRVVDVYKNPNGTTFDVFVALFDPASGNTVADEDMNLTEVSDLTNGIQCVFVNRDGDEFVTLIYNWCKEKRNFLLPTTYTISGEGYDPDEYDVPRVFGIIAGNSADTLNIIIDTHPSAEIGGVRTFTKTGTAPAGVDKKTAAPLSPSSTSGTGTGATFFVEASGGKYTVTVAAEGSGYVVNDTITILGTSIKTALGDTTNTFQDIVITVTKVNPTKQQYPAYNLFNYYPSVMVSPASGLNEDYGFTLPVFNPTGFRRVYGRQDTRYYLIEVRSADISAANDNDGHNTSIASPFGSFGYESIDFSDRPLVIGGISYNDNDIIPDTQTNYGVSLRVSDLRRTSLSFTSDEQFVAVAKYNLSMASAYRDSGTYLNTIGKQIFANYSQQYKVNRKKFPTSAPPSVGNLGSTLIKVSGIPGTTNLVSLKDVTIGAMSDANEISNTYGGAYHGGIISIENGQVELKGVRFRGNLTLDWSGLLTSRGSRLGSTNKFTYGHSVDLIETTGTIKVSEIGDNVFARLKVSSDDVNNNYYTMFRRQNNLYIEPNKLPTGKRVDYDSRVFPINTISQISKFDSSGNYNETVVLDEKYLSNVISYASTTGSSISGSNLRFNNSNNTTISAGTTGGHSDSSQALPTKTITFTRPYSTTAEQNESNLLAKNIYPNFTKIIRNGNPDSVLATVSNFEYYKKSNVAYFVLEYSGNIEYLTEQDTTSTTLDYSGFELQILTQFIQDSQRFNYVSTLTTRYIKKANADGTKYSKYEIGYDQAQKQSVFAINKDISIVKRGSGAVIPRSISGSPNIIPFTNKNKTSEPASDKLRVILETDADGEILSCDIVSLGFSNNPGDILEYYPTTGNGYEITMSKTTKARVNDSDNPPAPDYDMFEPGELVAVLENSCFVVNNFVETSLTSIKSALQKVKSVITPGNYILYGNQYYKIAANEPGRPYLGIYQYSNPQSGEVVDIRTSLVIRLEEKTYDISYTRTRNDEVITRFDLYEDDNLLKYWPNTGRLEIGELELCDFTKEYVNKNIGYRITLKRSNTNFWPSYIHDWDGLQITETFTAGSSPTDPAEAPPQISTGNLSTTELRLADPVDVTCSTYKRISRIGYESVDPYLTKTGIATTQRAYIDISSSSLNDQDKADANKFEIGQIVSMPWRNIGIGWHKRGSGDEYNYSPNDLTFTVDTSKGTKGQSGSSNRAGDNRISVIITNSREAAANISNLTTRNDGVARLTTNLNNPHMFVNANNNWGANTFISHEIFNKIDPLSVCRAVRSIGSILGKPHNDNNSATVTITTSSRTFTLSQGGNTNIGIGLVPGIVIKHDNLPKDTRISRITGPDVSGNFTITMNQSATANISGTVTFTNEVYVDLEVFHPIISDFTAGDTFKLVPAFNSEGHTYARHNYVFTSRISDIEIKSSPSRIRLYLADPFTYGNPDDTKFITHADSRYHGFISINHGGYSFPRSGGSYFPSNVVKVQTDNNKIKLPNYSGRIVAGDLFRYTYEARTVIQEINLDTRSQLTQRNRFRLQSITVTEGDSLVGFADNIVINNSGTPQYRYGVNDTYKQAGSYKVFHVRYADKTGKKIDNYRFGNSSTNSFWDSTNEVFTTLSPITKYEKGGTTYYVDIGAGLALSGFQSYSEKTANDLNNDVFYGVWDGTTQNTADPWRDSLVLTNGSGEGAVIEINVDNSGNITVPSIVDGGESYKVNDFIRVRGAVFNFDNPRYPKDLYLYVSDVATVGGKTGVITSFEPRFVLKNTTNSTSQPNDILQLFYSPSLASWVIASDPSDTSDEGVTGRVSTTVVDDKELIFIDRLEGNYVYLTARLALGDGGEIITYNVELAGGVTSGQKLIFKKPKAQAKLVTGTVSSVESSLDSDGYALLTIDSPDNILFSSYPDKEDWISIGDILISHSSDLFGNDGSVAIRFMHSEFGGTLEFDEFKVWNDWYQNASANKGFGLFGSHGWVGNWGRTIDGVRMNGLTSTGALTINWSRQRGNSIWKIAQPIRPAWTHRGTSSDVVANGNAFSPSMNFITANGTNTFFSSTLPNYLMEDNQVIDNIQRGNVIQHINNTTDDIKLVLHTNQQILREDWWAGRYYEGGMGPLSYQTYQWSSVFDSLSVTRTPNKNKISYQLQDLRFRNNTWGDINWGSGTKTRLTEFMMADYIQHYSIGPSYDNLYVNTGLKVKAGTQTDATWQGRVLTTDVTSYTSPASISNRNLRLGILTSSGSFVSGKKYIVKTSTNPEYVAGQVFTATGASSPANISNAYLYDTKIARGDAIYVDISGTKTFVGFVLHVVDGGNEGDANRIYLSQKLPAGVTGEHQLYYIRTKGLKYAEFESGYSQIGVDNKKGDTVLSASMPGAINYNASVVIQKRNYNTSPILNTLGDVKPVGNYWWQNGTEFANRSIRAQFGDLSAFNWSLMNINITRFNPKVHLESTVTVTSSTSTVGSGNVFI